MGVQDFSQLNVPAYVNPGNGQAYKAVMGKDSNKNDGVWHVYLDHKEFIKGGHMPAPGTPLFHPPTPVAPVTAAPAAPAAPAHAAPAPAPAQSAPTITVNPAADHPAYGVEYDPDKTDSQGRHGEFHIYKGVGGSPDSKTWVPYDANKKGPAYGVEYDPDKTDSQGRHGIVHIYKGVGGSPDSRTWMATDAGAVTVTHTNVPSGGFSSTDLTSHSKDGVMVGSDGSVSTVAAPVANKTETYTNQPQGGFDNSILNEPAGGSAYAGSDGSSNVPASAAPAPATPAPVTPDPVTPAPAASAAPVSDSLPTLPEMRPADDKPPAAAAPSAGSSSYTVVTGDTLSAIATAHNMSLSELEAMNPSITDPNLIMPGQNINLTNPSSGAPEIPTSSTYPPPPATAEADASKHLNLQSGWVQDLAADPAKGFLDAATRVASAGSSTDVTSIHKDNDVAGGGEG